VDERRDFFLELSAYRSQWVFLFMNLAQGYYGIVIPKNCNFPSIPKNDPERLSQAVFLFIEKPSKRIVATVRGIDVRLKSKCHMEISRIP
jgi:hypothetical protein